MIIRKIAAAVSIVITAWIGYQFMLGVLAGIDGARAEALTNEVLELQEAGRYAESLPKAMQVVQISPHSATAHYNLGVARTSVGDAAGAEASYRHAIGLDARHPGSWCNLSKVLMDTGRLAESVEAARTAIGLEPSDVNSHINLCAALAKSAQWDAALEAARTAVELAPGNAMAHQNLGAVLIETNELEEATRELERSVGLNPKSAAAWYGLTVAYCTQEDAEGAWKTIRRARENEAAGSIPESVVTAVEEAIGGQGE